ncbi:Ig-like domain-containing protein [Pimelobacter sp. 30-1]|uniref:Ig-like domain-containing protein n=1 Tax=Pimelobacter sp. 30-1 TaxID=2004991 RepID=UPI001C04D67B|nr:Ig-like domain-containing protein [Pimelobacter sp. 30-1]MBU2698556.1 hypothetical protein [Pimelobacter sp. 30-1]
MRNTPDLPGEDRSLFAERLTTPAGLPWILAGAALAAVGVGVLSGARHLDAGSSAEVVLLLASTVLIGVGQGLVLLVLLRWGLVSRRHRWTSILLVTVTVALTLALVTEGIRAASAEAAAGGAWAGYRIKAGKQADSAWIGGRKVGGQRVYRIEPTKRNVKSGYGEPATVADLNGAKAKPSARRTSVAACVLATYGARKDNIQAAAVDATTYHLLKGGKWRITKARGAQRIRQAGSSKYVRSYAKTMLANCGRLAGPYPVSMSSTTAPVGSATKVVFTIKSATGHGLANVPVTFSYGGSSPVAYTDSSGTATTYFNVTTAGVTRATARADRVPEWRLTVRSPKNKRASKVAVAGRLAAVEASTPVRASGAQTVVVANGSATLRVGQPLAGTYTVDGGSGTRTVARSAYGPFDTSATNCNAPRAYTSSTSMSSNGRFALPSWLPPKSGYYRWGVAVTGNELSTAASTCGASVRVIKQAAVAQDRPAGRSRTVKVGQGFDVDVVVSGFDRAEGHSLVSRLYGPFVNKDNARCVESKRVASKNQTRNVSGNGKVNMGNAAISSSANTGWYVWQTTLSTGDLVAGATSACGVLYEVVR